MGSSSSKAFDYDAQLLNDKNEYSIEYKTEGEDYKGCTVPRRNAKKPEGMNSLMYEDEDGGCKTVWELFQAGVKKFPDNELFGTRVYELDEKKSEYVKNDKGFPNRKKYFWETYTQTNEIVAGLGSGLLELGAKQGDNIGIFANNRAEWMQASLATYSQNMRTVSLYATLGNDAVEYICGHAETKVVFTEKAGAKAILKILDKMKLTTVVQFDYNANYGNVLDKIDEEDKKKYEEAGVKLVGFSEVLEMGRKAANPVNPPTADDLCYIMYTSGTTGKPKGAMLSHGNLASAVGVTPVCIPMSDKDVHLSYLPLAHIFETLVEVGMMANGAKIGYYQGNVKMLTMDMQEVKPTILCGVPRVFSRMYSQVFAKVAEANCIKQWAFKKGYNTQAALLRLGKPRDQSWDKKIFSKLAAKLGLQRCRMVVTGAAPCPPYLMEFLKIAFSAKVVQGYGMTESAACTSLSGLDDVCVGHVGPPVPACEVKLVDIPEMNYLSTDKPPRGEIQVRGPAVFKGYFKAKEKTEETIVDGWLCTGDVGRWNPNGTLSIIDRKKNIFKMANGEYIAAEKIENVYAKAPMIGQMWVYGNSFRNTVLAVVVPNAEAVVNFAKDKGWWKCEAALATPEFLEAFAKLCEEKADEIKKAVQASMATQNQKLKKFEYVKDILIEGQIDNMLNGFTEQNECLTPTFKLRRPFLLKRYVKQLKELYTVNGEPPQENEKWPGE